MRTLVWILGTLLSRSWLIVAGIALGLIARHYFPPTAASGQPEIMNPAAKTYYDGVADIINSGPKSQTETRRP
jgi:hypothetical protein